VKNRKKKSGNARKENKEQTKNKKENVYRNNIYPCIGNAIDAMRMVAIFTCMWWLVNKLCCHTAMALP
jgi:hypothetical protein